MENVVFGDFKGPMVPSVVEQVATFPEDIMQ